MSENKELEPCPFCGVEAELHDGSFKNGCLCPNEKCMLFARIFPIEQWNTRQPGQELDALKEFARLVIQEVCWGYSDADGLEIQDLAKELKLIRLHIATKDDVDEESDFEIGDEIYKFSKLLEKT